MEEDPKREEEKRQHKSTDHKGRTVGQQRRRKKPRQNCKHRPQTRRTRTAQARQHNGVTIRKIHIIRIVVKAYNPHG